MGYSGACEECGEMFLSKRGDARFCPDKPCRARAFDKKHPDRRRRGTVGEILRYHRRRLRLSKAACAKGIGCGRGTWRSWEADKTAPSEERAGEIAALFHLSVYQKRHLMLSLSEHGQSQEA